MSPLAGGALIFLLRLGDVPVGTVRTMLMVQGRRLPVAVLALAESTIWVLAISRALKGEMLNDPFRVAGWAAGFAAGTVLGMTIERWLAFGRVLVRIISRDGCAALREKLLEENYGVTSVPAEGRDGQVLILFVVLQRRRLNPLLKIIRDLDPHAFITHEPVSEAIGGYLPTAGEANLGKK